MRNQKSGQPRAALERVGGRDLFSDGALSSPAARLSSMRNLLRPTLFLGLLLGGMATLVMAAWTPGPPFQVNTFTAGSQLWPAVGMNANGATVIAWTSFGQDGDNFGIFAQRYDAGGVAVGSEFQVNTTTAGEQRQPAAALDAAGNFVIVWSQPGATSDAIFGRVYDGSNGQPLGTEFQVNTFLAAGTRFRSQPVVAMDANGNFAVVWEGTSTDEVSGGIFARLFDSSGMPLGNRAEFVVNTTTADVQSEPAVAMNANGDFVVAWTSRGQDAPFSDGVFAQRFDAAGNPLGGEFQVNTTTAGNQFQPAVTIDSTGNVVTAWVSTHTGGIFARSFPNGTSPGDEVPVSTLAAQSHRGPSVGMDATGNVVVTWDMTDNNDTASIQARLFDSSLMPQAVEFQVSDAAHDPIRNALRMDASGNFVVAWEDRAGADGEHSGVFARRYTSPVAPLSLSIDDVRVFEGDSGFFNAVFTVSLSRPSPNLVTVDFATADGTAGAALTGADYQERSGTVFFDPDETSQQIAVRVNGDTFGEADETFFVNLTDPVGAPIVRQQGVGTILNDDNWLSIDDVAVTEGNSGTKQMTFTVSVLPDVSDHRISVAFATTSGSVGFVPQSGTLIFQPREGLKEISITINGDLIPELDETLFVNLGDSTNAIIAKAVGIGRIINDDFTFGIVGNQFQVNSTVSEFQWSAAVARNAAGRSVVAWSSEIPGVGEGIFAQRFNAEGTRAGSQFRVDDTTGVCTSFPRRREPAVGMDADGDFVIVWTTAAFAISGTQFDEDYAFSDVCAQRYSDDGTPLGSNFQVDTNLNHTAHSQSPAIGMYGSGDFVVAWSGVGPRAGRPRAIFARSFDANGAPLGSTNSAGICNNAFTGAIEPCDILVNSTSNTFIGLHPSVAVTPAVPGCPVGLPGCGTTQPDFFIAWSNTDIFARRFAGGSGGPLGNEFLVNTYTDNAQERPLARVDEHGRLVVVWQGEGDGGRLGIFGQRFGTGCAIGFICRDGSQFDVFAQQGSLGFVRAGLAMSAQHGFVVTWNNFENDASANHAIYARFFAPDGTPQGDLFQVNGVGSTHFRPAAGMDSSGKSLIAWEGGNDGSGSGILARSFEVLNTLAGTNIGVAIPPVALTFANVTQAGNTTLTPTASGPAPPSGFKIGNPPLYYDLNTSAVFSGNVTVCIRYSGVAFSAPTGPQLFHFEKVLGIPQWVDVTSLVDPVHQTVCGIVTSLSPFGLFEPTDVTPPVITADIRGTPGLNGWFTSDVLVRWTLTDPESAITSSSGCEPASVVADTAGITFTCTATSGGGTASSSVTIKVDKTPPTISGSRAPAPNANGWNNGPVTVTFECADALSGLAAGSPPAPSTLSGEGDGQSVSGTCFDMAGNSASGLVGGINIDLTPPLLTVLSDPPPNANGWNNTTVTVSFVAVDALSGVASVSAPVTLTAEGAGQVVAGSATDRAGNVALAQVSVNIDKTSPEAFHRFDPVTGDLLVFGRDALSGISPGPVAPSSVVPAPHDAEDDDEDKDDSKSEGEAEHDDADGRGERRTYTVVDLAGNTLVLVEAVKREGHEIKARIESLEYNGAAAIPADRNRTAFQWSAAKDGMLKELEQKMEIRRGRGRQEVEAKFRSKENETTLTLHEPERDRKLVRPGLLLLRMATDHGLLAIEFDP